MAVDFYLDEQYEKEREDIIRLSTWDPIAALIRSKLEFSQSGLQPQDVADLSDPKLTGGALLNDVLHLTTNTDVKRELTCILKLKPDEARKQVDKRIMGYVREAQSAI